MDECHFSRASWYLSKKEIEENSPSRKDGIDLKKESYLRRAYTAYIQELGKQMKLPQLTIATGIVFCHRFFLRQSHLKNEWRIVATACLFLAGKAESSWKSLDQFTIHVMRKCNPGVAQNIDKTKIFSKQKELIVVAEKVVLITLDFDFDVSLPYKPLFEAVNKLNLPNRALTQVAWNFLNDGLRTSLPLQFKGDHIAVATIFLASRFLKVELPSIEGKSLWQEYNVNLRDIKEICNQLLDLYELQTELKRNVNGGGSTEINLRSKRGGEHEAEAPNSAREVELKGCSMESASDKIAGGNFDKVKTLNEGKSTEIDLRSERGGEDEAEAPNAAREVELKVCSTESATDKIADSDFDEVETLNEGKSIEINLRSERDKKDESEALNSGREVELKGCSSKGATDKFTDGNSEKTEALNEAESNEINLRSQRDGEDEAKAPNSGQEVGLKRCSLKSTTDKITDGNFEKIETLNAGESIEINLRSEQDGEDEVKAPYSGEEVGLKGCSLDNVTDKKTDEAKGRAAVLSQTTPQSDVHRKVDVTNEERKVALEVENEKAIEERKNISSISSSRQELAYSLCENEKEKHQHDLDGEKSEEGELRYDHDIHSPKPSSPKGQEKSPQVVDREAKRGAEFAIEDNKLEADRKSQGEVHEARDLCSPKSDMDRTKMNEDYPHHLDDSPEEGKLHDNRVFHLPELDTKRTKMNDHLENVNYLPDVGELYDDLDLNLPASDINPTKINDHPHSLDDSLGGKLHDGHDFNLDDSDDSLEEGELRDDHDILFGFFSPGRAWQLKEKTR